MNATAINTATGNNPALKTNSMQTTAARMIDDLNTIDMTAGTSSTPRSLQSYSFGSGLLSTVMMAVGLVVLPLLSTAVSANPTPKVLATWVAPADGSVLVAPATIIVSVDAAAKQTNHPIVSVEIFNGTASLGRLTTPTSGVNYQLTWPNVSPGTYSLTATATNDKGDVDTSVPVTITVIKANQAITGFNPATPITYAPNTSITLTATGGASANPVIFASTTPTVCTVNANTVTIQSAGTCTLTADQAGNINYNAAPQATATVTINKANQTIVSFNPTTPITYVPNTSITLTATGGASGNPVIFASSTPTVCTVNANTVTIQSAGSCTLTADQAGNINYIAAPQQTATVLINKANQVITGFNPASPITYNNGGTFTLTAAGGGSANAVTFASTTLGVCTVAGNTVNVLSAGTCSLTADQAGNINYNAAPQALASVTINKANQAITGFTPTSPIVYQPAPNHTFTLTATGGGSGNPVLFASTAPAVCTVSGNVVTLLVAGACTLTADQSGNTNYNAAMTATATVVINKRPQTLTFAALSDKNLGDAPFPVTATSSVSLPVALTSTSTTICTVANANPVTGTATATLLAAGVCTLKADQAGDAVTAAATSVTQSFTVAATSAQLYYIHADHLGTPRAITRPTDNTVVWRWENTDPFGANLPNENPSGQGTFSYNLRFPGQYYDQETGTHYNYFRDYDPSIGRYVQSDPIGLQGGLATYLYVSAAPLRWTDRDGLKIDWGNFVVSNSRVRSNFERLNSLIAETGIDDDCFILRVTGGDRYRRSPKTPNEHRSATNDQIIPTSDRNSPHLVDSGARALDFAIVNRKKDCCTNQVTEQMVLDLLPRTEFEPTSTRRHYPNAPHIHINLPNRREFYLWP